MRNFKNLNLLNLSPDEKIVCVQRQNWHTVAFALIAPVTVTLITFAILLYINIQTIIALHPTVKTIALNIFLLVVAISLIFITYIFLFWYYQFYIITNKRIVHRRHFTLGGRHMDEVFIDATPIREIVRMAPNPFYDLLHLEDVYVHFQRLERPDPFIFKTPMEPRVVEKVMERAAVQKFDIEE